MEFKVPEMSNRVTRIEDIFVRLLNAGRIDIPETEKDQILLELDRKQQDQIKYEFARVVNARKTPQQVRERVSRIAPPLAPNLIQAYFHGIPYYNGNLFDPEHEYRFPEPTGNQLPSQATDWGIKDICPRWTEYARHESSAEIEADLIMWLNRAELVVDWSATIDKFDKVLNQKLNYTDEAMVECLIRMANYFEKIPVNQLERKSKDELATILINLQKPSDKIEHYRAQLSATTREPGETLMKAVQKADLIINQLYPRPEDAYMRKTLQMQALLAFSHDKLVKAYNHQFQKVLNKNLYFERDRIIKQISDEEQEYGLKITMAQRFDRLDQDSKKMQLNNITIDKRIRQQFRTPFRHKAHKDLYSKAQNFVRKRDREEFRSARQYNDYIMDYLYNSKKVETPEERNIRLEEEKRRREEENRRRQEEERHRQEEEAEYEELAGAIYRQAIHDQQKKGTNNGLGNGYSNNTSDDGQFPAPMNSSTPQLVLKGTAGYERGGSQENLDDSLNDTMYSTRSALDRSGELPGLEDSKDSSQSNDKTVVNVPQGAGTQGNDSQIGHQRQIDSELQLHKETLENLAQKIHQNEQELPQSKGGQSEVIQKDLGFWKEQHKQVSGKIAHAQVQSNIFRAKTSLDVNSCLDQIQKVFNMDKTTFETVIESMDKKVQEDLEDAKEGRLASEPYKVLNIIYQTANNKLLDKQRDLRHSKLTNIMSSYGYKQRKKSRDKRHNKTQNRESRKDKHDKKKNKDRSSKQSSQKGQTYNQGKHKGQNKNKDKKYKDKKRQDRTRTQSSHRSASQPRSASQSSYYSSRGTSASSATSGQSSRDSSSNSTTAKDKSKERYKKKIKNMEKEMKTMKLMMANSAYSQGSPLKCKKCNNALHPGKECEPLVNVTEMGQTLVNIGHTMQNLNP